MTLLIKRKFLEKIKSGEKTVEYRDITPRYAKYFKSKPRQITLLCQHEKLVVKVLSIKRCWGKYAIKVALPR